MQDDPNYNFNHVDVIDRAKVSEIEKFKRQEAERQAREVRISCVNCAGVIPTDDRGPGVRFCSTYCEDMDGDRGEPGSLFYTPRTPAEKAEHRRKLRGKNYAPGGVK